jgi:cytochrome c2
MKTILVAAALALMTGAAAAAGDIEAGETQFKKCMACHAVGEGAKNRVGPVLNDVFGRVAGTYPDYKYSDAMIAAGAGGVVWTEETLSTYLKKPRDFVPGTKMAFVGLPNQADIDNLLAYLITLSPNYVPAEAAPPAP